MTIFDVLHYYSVNHAVICNQVWGMSDWFVVCNKSQLRNVPLEVEGVYQYEGNELYIIGMSRQDIGLFYEMMSFGYYNLINKNSTFFIYEIKDNSFRSYICKKKMNKRIKIKIWKKL